MGDSEDFADRLAAQQRLLEAVRKGGEPGEVGDVESQGHSADKSVTVTLRNRRVVTVSVAKSVPGRPHSEIGTLLATAVNTALSEYRATAPSAQDPMPDLAGLQDQLREANDHGGYVLRMIGSALQDVIAAVGPRTGMQGDTSSNFVDLLFADTMDTLESAQESLSGLAGPEVTGTGCDEDEEISATVGPDGMISAIEFSGAARDMSGPTLGQVTREAVNEALDDWEHQRRGGADPAVDTEALQQVSTRAESLREHSMEHLRGYTTNLQNIMRSIGPP